MIAPAAKHTRFFFIFAVLFAMMTAFLVPHNAYAQMKGMNNAQLSEVYAEGFSKFTITSTGGIDTTYALFNIMTNSYIEIDSLKLGYHNKYDYKNPTPSYGWDEDWTNVQIGGAKTDASKDFHTNSGNTAGVVTDGVYFSADFTNINTPATRELKAIRIGATSVTGDISATFNSFSGTIDDSNDNTPEYNGHGLNLGTKTITATASKFELSLSIDGYDKGYWVTFTNATVH
ncbi:MAG: hypothetical protein GXP53_06005 [Deltaproteobacteria bacterium]|nr:hypothetical protein [Deltaproteobacteria bacterium]